MYMLFMYVCLFIYIYIYIHNIFVQVVMLASQRKRRVTGEHAAIHEATGFLEYRDQNARSEPTESLFHEYSGNRSTWLQKQYS